MRIRTLLLLCCLFLIASTGPVIAQQTADGPYLVGAGGGLFGEQSSGSVALGFGYMTPRRIGLEVELAWSPSILEPPDPQIAEFPRIVGPTGITIFPTPEISVDSRLLTFQTNVVGVLGARDSRLSAIVEAGGGVADVHRDAHLKTFSPQIPSFAELLTNPLAQIAFATIERDVSSSQTSLVLGAGGGFEYALTDHLALGSQVRYQHIFTSGDALDHVRVEARVRWKF